MNAEKSRNFDKLDALIMLAGDVLIEKDVAYARSLDTTGSIISKRVDRKIKQNIRMAFKSHEYWRGWIIAKRVVAVLLIACTVLFASAMSIEAVRTNFWNAIIEWFDDYISIRFNQPTIESSENTADLKEPSYLPDGYKAADKFKTDYSNKITYYVNDTKALIYNQKVISTNETLIDNENCTIRDIEIGGYPGVLAIYSDDVIYYTLTWKDQKYIYKIETYYFDLFEDELMKIAESIYQ